MWIAKHNTTLTKCAPYMIDTRLLWLPSSIIGGFGSVATVGHGYAWG